MNIIFLAEKLSYILAQKICSARTVALEMISWWSRNIPKFVVQKRVRHIKNSVKAVYLQAMGNIVITEIDIFRIDFRYIKTGI